MRYEAKTHKAIADTLVDLMSEAGVLEGDLEGGDMPTVDYEGLVGRMGDAVAESGILGHESIWELRQ